MTASCCRACVVTRAARFLSKNRPETAPAPSRANQDTTPEGKRQRIWGWVGVWAEETF